MLSGVMRTVGTISRFRSKKVAFRHAAESFRYCRLGAANASVGPHASGLANASTRVAVSRAHRREGLFSLRQIINPSWFARSVTASEKIFLIRQRLTTFS